MPKVIHFHQTGDASVLRVEEEPEPAVGEDEIRLKVEAIGLNRAEILYRMGRYLEQPIYPAKNGYDACGIVDAVGRNVQHVKVGDRVATIPTFSLTQYGVYGESVLLPGHAVTPVPDSISAAEATTMGVQFMTVYFAMFDVGALQRGQTLLATAASSSTGVAAIQVAKVIGARAIGTTRTAAKKQSLLDHGADDVIVTDDEDLVQRVMDITDGHGADVIFDPIAGKMMSQLTEAVAPMGRIMLYGLLDGSDMTLSSMTMLRKSYTLGGYIVFGFTGSQKAGIPRNDEAVARATKFIHDKLADGSIKPVIAKRFEGIESMADAHRYMESCEQIGKIVVEP
jgi:NADPH:quinone reductase-like Zn-dependent oxidoreductase